MKKIILGFCIILLAGAFRFYYLDRPDITADEGHYINDAYRLYNKDPYISIRHHAFRHAAPSIGHPFLMQILTSGVFKEFGVSIFSARLPSALTGISTVAVLLFFGYCIGYKKAFVAAFFLAVNPFAVRFSRDAHLDSLFTLWLTLIIVLSWYFFQTRKNIFLIFIGIISGFAISTKLDGVIGFFLAAIFLILIKFFTKREGMLKKTVLLTKNILIILFPLVIVSFLLNDPKSYLDGIIHPSDPAYTNLQRNIITLIKEVPIVFFQVNFYLLSPFMLITYIISFIVILKKSFQKHQTSIFLLFWQLPIWGLFILHMPGISGEYGWLPLVPAILVSVSFLMSSLGRKIGILFTIIIFTFSLKYLYWFGLRYKQVPYLRKNSTYNRTINDNFYSSVINFVNKAAPKKSKIFFLPQTEYPLFSLRSDLSWSYYGGFDDFKILVVERKLNNSETENYALMSKMSGKEDGREVTRYLYKSINKSI